MDIPKQIDGIKRNLDRIYEKGNSKIQKSIENIDTLVKELKNVNTYENCKSLIKEINSILDIIWKVNDGTDSSIDEYIDKIDLYLSEIKDICKKNDNIMSPSKKNNNISSPGKKNNITSPSKTQDRTQGKNEDRTQDKAKGKNEDRTQGKNEDRTQGKNEDRTQDKNEDRTHGKTISSQKKIKYHIVAPTLFSPKKEGAVQKKLPPPVKVELEDEDQREHFKKIMDILKYNFFAMDISPMGTGKTHIASKVAQDLDLPKLIVICPPTVEPTWKKAEAKYGLRFVKLANNQSAIMSYESLRGMKEGIVSSGLLNKSVSIKPNTKNTKITTYEPTEFLRNIVRQGCLFIFDEFHKTKESKTSTHASVKGIASIVKDYFYHNDESKRKSRMLFLTGSPFVKEEEVLNFLSLVGIYNAPKLYTNYKSQFKLEDNYGTPLGYKEIYNYAYDLDPELTTGVVNKELAKNAPKKSTKKAEIQKLTVKNVKVIAYKLYTDVIEKYISSEMEPIKIDVPTDIKNGFYNIIPENLDKIKKSVKELAENIGYNENGENFVKGRGNTRLGEIQKELMDVEYYELEAYIRKTVEALESNPNNKAVIILQFVKHIKICYEILKNYNPDLLYGKTDKKSRNAIIQRFNQPDNEYRLLITQLTVISLGVELDDKIGGFPRYVFISPNYRSIDTHQVNARFYRRGTKETPHIRYVYAKGVPLQIKIINAYAKKSKVLAETLKKQAAVGVMFPGQYPKEEEVGKGTFTPFSYGNKRIGSAEKLFEYIEDIKDEFDDSLPQPPASTTKTIVSSDNDSDYDNDDDLMYDDEYDYSEEESDEYNNNSDEDEEEYI